MHDYLLYGSLTFLLSILFSMGGAGSGVALSAIVGGYIGNYMMQFKLEQHHIKKLMALLLYMLALKLLFGFLV